MSGNRKSRGNNNPNLDPRAILAHDVAVANGEKGYCDPITGNYTFTAASLKEQGFCCQNKCRHCPWPPEEQLPLSLRLP